MDDRRKILELYAKQVANGNPLSDEFLPHVADESMRTKALFARDLAEDALAQQVLKNTGVPIPGKGSSRSKAEDFFNRIAKERYPEIEPDVRINDLGGEVAGNYGNGIINLDKAEAKKDLIRSVSGVLHESGHQYDDKFLGAPSLKGLANEKGLVDKVKSASRRLDDIDPTHAYELIAQGHHANIPKLREGSYGLGALKSMMKNGTFKSVPVIGTGLAAYSALDTGDVMAAVPGLDSAENVGESVEEEKLMLAEDQARKNYEKSPAAAARKQALSSLAQPTLAKK